MALYDAYGEKVTAGLAALLSGDAEELTGLTEYLSLHRVILGDGGFCFLISKVRPPREPEGTILEYNGAFARCLEAALTGQAVHYMLPVQGLVVCLIAMPQQRESQAARLEGHRARFHDAARSAIRRFTEETGAGVLTAASPMVFGLESLPGSFRRTVDMVRFHHFFGQRSGLVTPPEVSGARPIELSILQSSSAARAVNFLSVQQFETFRQIVMEHLDLIRDYVPASLQQYKMHCVQYLDALCYRVVQSGMGDEALLERTDIYWLVDDSASQAAMKEAVAALLDRLTAAFREGRLLARLQRADRMRQYILEHFTDCDLNVTTLARQFGMSQPTFSAYFKKHTGAYPLEYLTRQRLQRASDLLKTTEHTLPVVARASGFGSVSTMHRIFKAELGMTPSQVRAAPLSGQPADPPQNRSQTHAL